MILFYSNYCKSSQMLMDQLGHYGVKKYFKFVNVERLQSKGLSVPTCITAVPSLMIMPQKDVLTDKKLFDYLLLPNKGLVFNLDKMASPKAEGGAQQSGGTGAGGAGTGTGTGSDGEPSAFGFKNNSSSDLFSFIEEDEHPNADPHKQYNWANLEERNEILTGEMTAQTESEKMNGKSSPDLSKLQADRALDIQNFLNTSTMPPTSLSS